MNLEFIKPQNLGSLLMKSSQSNFNLRSPSSFLVRKTEAYMPHQRAPNERARSTPFYVHQLVHLQLVHGLESTDP